MPTNNIAIAPGLPARPMDRSQKARIFAQQGRACLICQAVFLYEEMTRHHIILKCRGGSDNDANICLICRPCHGLCHHYDKRIQHDALRPILMQLGLTAPERAKLYAMYRAYGVFGPKIKVIRGREHRKAISQWADDGGFFQSEAA